MRNPIYLLLALAAFSCGGDDKDASGRRLLKHISISEQAGDYHIELEFTYDSRNRIDQVALSGETNDVFTYSYNNRDQIAGIGKAAGEDLLFEYDQDGRLSGYTEGVADYAVNYDQATGAYTVEGREWILRETGDIASEAGSDYLYETDQYPSLKGPLHDAVGESYHLTGMVAHHEFPIFMVKDAFHARVNPNNANDISNYWFTNTYDSHDYRTGTVIVIYGITVNYSFEYYD